MSRARCWEKRESKDDIIRGYCVCMITLKSLVSKKLQWVTGPNNKVAKKALAVVYINSYCRKDVAGHAQQKSP